PHEQLERRLRIVEVEALALELLDLPREPARRLAVRVELEAELARPLDDVVAAGELADEDPPPVPDPRRIDVLVRRRVTRNGVDVDAALVRERRLADIREALVRRHGREVVDE